MDDRCPDCRHKVSDHDMFGCTYIADICPTKCSLSAEFLIAYLSEESHLD